MIIVRLQGPDTRLAVLVAYAGFMTALITAFLVGFNSHSQVDPADIDGTIVGYLRHVDIDRVVLEGPDGRLSSFEFGGSGLAPIDVAHAFEHSLRGSPTRVLYRTDGDRKIVAGFEDVEEFEGVTGIQQETPVPPGLIDLIEERTPRSEVVNLLGPPARRSLSRAGDDPHHDCYTWNVENSADFIACFSADSRAVLTTARWAQ